MIKEEDSPQRSEIHKIVNEEEKVKRDNVKNRIKERFPQLDKKDIDKIMSDIDSYGFTELP